jgi:GTP:adenosylcobinamide-phosphate guanylyltransferase
MDAIISAGGTIDPGNPLYDLSKGGPKAMIELAGKPMIQWIVDALNQSELVDSIFIVGLPDDTQLKSEKTLYFLPGGKTLMDSALSGMYKIVELKPDTAYCLFVSTDIPAITKEIIDWMISSAVEPGIDIFYNVIPRDVMEKRFPESKRSYIRFKDVTVCSGDMHVFNAQRGIAFKDDVKWKNIVESRKLPLNQMVAIGFDLLFRMIFKKPTLEDAVKLVCRRLGINGRVVVSPYAELGMDIDKPFQLNIVAKELKKQFDQNV